MRIVRILGCLFVPLELKKHVQMKRFLVIPLLAVAVPMLMSHTGMEHTCTYDSTDSTTHTAKDTTVTVGDTAVSVNDTLPEVEVKAKKELSVVEAINNSLKSQPIKPGSKSVSDIIGEKATDYIMHPFAWRERRKEKNLKKTKDNLKRLDTAKTYEDELTEAINRQLKEDSIAEARKKEQQERQRR